MRIVLITAQYQPATVGCGVGDYTRCLRGALESLGHQSAVLTSFRSKSTEADVYRLTGRWGPRDTAAAWHLLGSLQPDAVIVQYTPEHYGFGPVFKLLPLLLRCRPSAPRVLTTFHTLVGGRWISQPYAALLAAESHGVVSTNGELTDLFRRRLGWWKETLREIPIGANIPGPRLTRDEARRHLRRLDDGPDLADRRATFAAQHSWSQRVAETETILAASRAIAASGVRTGIVPSLG